MLLFFVVLFALLLNIPIFVDIKIEIKLLTLSGKVSIVIMGIPIIRVKVRIVGNEIIIVSKKKTTRQKIDKENQNLAFINKLISMLYFRQHITRVDINGQFGYKNNALTTSIISSIFLVSVVGLFSKLKNNKQDANIHVVSVPKYDRDIFEVRLASKFNMSLFDIIFTLVITQIRMVGVNNEGTKTRQQKSTIAD